jgi:hypothetical protein
LRNTEQVALLPDDKTSGLHDRLLSPSAPPNDTGGPPELVGGGLLGGGVLGGGLLGGGVLGGGLTGGGPTRGLTEIAPAAPLRETEAAAGVAPITLETPAGTRLAAEEDKVTVMTATTPSEIGLALGPEIRHTNEPGLLAHCTVLALAVAEGPSLAEMATILPVS